MNKLKSPVYICFLIGFITTLTGLGLMVVGGEYFGPQSIICIMGKYLFPIGVLIYGLPLTVVLIDIILDKIKKLNK